jgi:hypothetical protein
MSTEEHNHLNPKKFSSGTSSLSQAVHAALANVIQDPIGDNQQTIASGDSIINNLNRCENCSKLRQQLTLLIYEVLNLENTMESKICEYVQRRLSEIAISEQSKTTENIKPNDSNTENIGWNSLIHFERTTRLLFI